MVEEIFDESSCRWVLEEIKDYAIFTIDMDGRVASWNKGAERILGFSEAEIVGQSASRIFTREDIESGAPERELMKAATEGRAEDIRWHVRKDDTRFWADGLVMSMRHEGELRGFVKVLRDSTERKQGEEERAELLERERAAREEAEAANRLKDEFLATLSHELRTPLTSMIGWSRLLRAGGLDGGMSSRAIDAIERAANAQAKLIDDLLDVSRIITGKLHLEARPARLASIVEAAIEAARLTAEAKTVGLRVNLGADACFVSGDPNRLQQVVSNLLSNGIKFTPAGGHVSVDLHCADDFARLVVSDTGQGIPPEFLPHVFDRFRQADGTTTRAAGGLGLGLSIVRHLVELHGGTIRAESEGAGRGATFTVTLPLLKAGKLADAGLAVEGEAALDCPPSVIGLRVFVVDDEADTRELLRLALEHCGASVASAASVKEALNLLEESKPDVLISDIGMPDEDGYELIRRVRLMRSEHGGSIPALALTAYAGEENRQRALDAGFQVHIAKPIEPTELLSVIASLARSNKKDRSG